MSNTFFQGGRKILFGGFDPLRPRGYGSGKNKLTRETNEYANVANASRRLR